MLQQRSSTSGYKDREGKGIERLSTGAFANSRPERGLKLEEAFFAEGADGLGADFHFSFFAINNKSLNLEVGLPDFFSMALREAHIVAVLLTFTGDITFLHYTSQKLTISLYFTDYNR